MKVSIFRTDAFVPQALGSLAKLGAVGARWIVFVSGLLGPVMTLLYHMQHGLLQVKQRRNREKPLVPVVHRVLRIRAHKF